MTEIEKDDLVIKTSPIGSHPYDNIIGIIVKRCGLRAHVLFPDGKIFSIHKNQLKKMQDG